MRLPPTAYNALSYGGMLIALAAFAAFIFLFIFHTFTEGGRTPYAGLVIFLFIPAIMMFGVMLIPLGMALEWRRLRRGGRVEHRFPVIDLNNLRHRNAFTLFAVGTVLLLFLSAFGGYQAYHQTESVPFCGTLCHEVMRPEYTTYQASPHERVPCVDCHVGEGADWFVKSKISGLYQVYAVAFNTYPRPIPTPIESLRPSRETCERCHWPEQFFGGQQKKLIHFLPDERNSRWDIELLIKIGGGGNPARGLTEGIHWHMNVANHVEYIATDDRRQTIPWVRMTNLNTKETTTYVSTEGAPTPEMLAKTKPRVMDCMDCHNRPTHKFRSPSAAVNVALATGSMDPSLPFLKRTAVELLAGTYGSQTAAFQAIDAGLRRFYAEKYPDVARSKETAITRAVEELKEIYRTNFFPEMKARWDAYPDNIGHVLFPGCARCHDGQHKSADGRVITTTCTACHTITAQGPPSKVAFAGGPNGLQFQHPEDIGEAASDMAACSGCHTGQTP